MAGDILAFVLAAAFGGWILSFVVTGLRTGRIHHTDGTSVFVFRKQPWRFILVAVLFILFASMFLYVAIYRALVIWQKLFG